ncbi:MAG TPA: D-glycero-beta-D-manno-heptose-7-phosphate kinase [Nitrospiria bacterium]|nr:D-glycero-beta-D-manno-heptose-7-phosphate kinase [Nitrospiria bacterium]
MTGDAARLRGWATGLSGARVAVLGDLMLDRFIWGRVSRISPEAPVPVVEVTSESVLLGGAGNVFLNLQSLGASVSLCGVVGDDAPGSALIDLLRARGASLDGVLAESGRPTTQKTRVIAHQQQVVRVDRERRAPLAAKTRDAIIEAVDAALDRANCLVVSDYAKGVVSPELMDRVRTAASRRGVEILVDPKVSNMPCFTGVHVVTPNHLEASQASGVEIVDAETLAQAGRTLVERFRIAAVLITRGEHGMSLFERNGGVTHIPTVAKQVFDVTGAGDTVIATLAAARSIGAPLADAARLANCAAGYVVGVVGTAAVTPDALRRQLDEYLAEVPA